MKKILIAAGGTGGHIYPAKILAGALKGQGWSVVLIGVLGDNALTLRSAGFEVVEIRARGFIAKSFGQKLMAVLSFFAALGDSLRTVGDMKPDVVIGFGGYSSLPAVLAGVLMGRRTMIHEQNVVPGAANRLLGLVVDRICVGFKETTASFSRQRTAWTGTPLRPMSVARGREEILRGLGLDTVLRTVLVMGGSQGSRAINDSVIDSLLDPHPVLSFQVIHLAGKLDFPRVAQRYRSVAARHAILEYAENMPELYSVADLVVARSGAGTVTELGVLVKPSVLVPYPGAGGHQLANARVLERTGLSVIIEEKDLSAAILRDKILLLLNRTVLHQELTARIKDEFLPDPLDRLKAEVGLRTDC
jgi:UDP-N-acetylglucosamine--N-acetylmuramyl-(pentapeptide) pyrophosphoryl-undecaprenol N-acetylglucosamine transferase